MMSMSRARPCLLCVCMLCLSGCSLFDEIALSESTGLDAGVMPPDMSDAGSQMPDAARQDAFEQDDSLPAPDAGEMREDMEAPDLRDMSEPVVPEGWWSSAWTRRHEVLVQDGWGADIVLPVRIDAGMSAYDGEDLVVLFEGASTPLPHEVESWSQEGPNVIWVRFPDGLRLGDKLHIYSHVESLEDASRMMSSTSVWKDLARHAYHFDGRDDFVVRDRASDTGVDLLKQGMITAAPPTLQMGKHLVLTEQTPNLKSGSSISAIHVADDQATTIEAHYIVPSLPDHPGERRLISDEDRCHGLSYILTDGLVIVRFVQSNGTCSSDTPDAPVATQTISTRRYQAGDALHVFTTFDWETRTMTTTVNGDDVAADELDVYPATRLTPVRVEVGGAPFTESQHPLMIDTLVVHDRVLSEAEIALIHRATHRNDTVFRALETISLAPQR